MATAEIKDFAMTYSSALDIAREVDNKRLDFNGMRDTLDHLVDNLSGQWQGTGQFEFETIYGKLKPKTKTISEVMARYSTEIRNVVSNEQAQDTAVSKTFIGIGGGTLPIVGAGNDNTHYLGKTNPAFPATSSSGADWFGVDYSDGNPGISAYIGNAHSETTGNFGSGEVNAYVGKAKAEAKAKAGIFKFKEKTEYSEEEWSTKDSTAFVFAEAKAEASVKAAGADAEGKLGSDKLGIGGKVEGSIGNAEGEAKATFSVSEGGVDAYLKGKAMVSAAEGKASGTISLFGLDIKATIKGHAGAVGVEGKAGVQDNKVVFEGGVAAVIGASVGVEVGFNDTGWTNFVDGIKDAVDYITFWN